tara:strand:- start:110 stop:715 length:606 start_codon:yes stop_codon:yes gene_type:complete
MKTQKLVLLFAFVLCSCGLFSQIEVVEQTSSNTLLIGKISHTSAFQKAGLSRKLPIVDPLKRVSDIEKITAYKKLRTQANEAFASVGIRRMDLVGEEFSASLLFFKDQEKYLLTFKNSSYNYQNESFWISAQTKKELYQLLDTELNKKVKFKNIEVVLDNNIVLVISINRKKVSFSLWDGYNWVNSYWYRHFKITNLFGES